MFKGRDVIGKTIVSYDAGEKFDVVEDLIFDQNSNQLLGFLVQEAGWFRRAQVLLLSDVQSIRADAVITSSRGAIANAHELPDVGSILDHNTILKGTHILTMDGRDPRDFRSAGSGDSQCGRVDYPPGDRQCPPSPGARPAAQLGLH